METNFEAEMLFKDLMFIYERRVANLQATGGMSIRDRKQPMSQVGYRFIAIVALKQDHDYNLYASYHLLLLLCGTLLLVQLLLATFSLI